VAEPWQLSSSSQGLPVTPGKQVLLAASQKEPIGQSLCVVQLLPEAVHVLDTG
jgi:hypothetical protein